MFLQYIQPRVIYVNGISAPPQAVI